MFGVCSTKYSPNNIRFPVTKKTISRYGLLVRFIRQHPRNDSICNTILELFKQKLDTTPPIKVNNSVKTPYLNDLNNSDNTKNMSHDVDVQPVLIKEYFRNEIYELSVR